MRDTEEKDLIGLINDLKAYVEELTIMQDRMYEIIDATGAVKTWNVCDLISMMDSRLDRARISLSKGRGE